MSSSSLPLMARRSNDAVVSFGRIGALFENYPELGPLEPFPLSTGITNADIPNTLRTLHILLGHGLFYAHDLMLRAILRHTASNCTSLKTVCILAYSSSWTEERQDLVRGWRSAPRVLYTARIIDSRRTSEALVSWRYLRTNSLGTELWQPESALMLPLDHIRDHAEEVNKLPRLRSLYLTPPVDRSTFLDHRTAIFQDFAQLLTGLPVLHTVSFPLDLSPYLISLLKPSNRQPCVVELNASPGMANPPELLADLAACFHNFHLLQKLSLPSGVLCNLLLDCLGDLQGLQEQTIIATSPVPTVMRTHHAHNKFQALQTLIVFGSTALQPDIKAVLRAFAGSRLSIIKKIKVEAGSLSNRKEMKRTLGIILRYCPNIDELDICINGTTDAEGNDWVNLSCLARFNLRVFKIQHPRPIPLTDNDIRCLLETWRSAESVSLNPRPTHPPGYSVQTAQSPTLDCLKYASRHGSLRHFGVYLDPQPQAPLSSLEELDLGTADVERTLLERLFPNAVRL